MRKALIAKNKLGFIDGTLTLSSPMVKILSSIQYWIHCDSMVGSWILNSVSPQIATSIIYKDTALDIWNNLKEQFSQGNGPWVFLLQKDIAAISQGDQYITVYFTQLQAYWDQLQNFHRFPNCTCGNCTCNLSRRLGDLQLQDSVMQFLMGLNKTYGKVRTQILLMGPISSINKVYSLLIQKRKATKCWELCCTTCRIHFFGCKVIFRIQEQEELEG